MLFCLVLGFLPFEDPQRIVRADFVPFSEAEEDGIFVSEGTAAARLHKSTHARELLADCRMRRWSCRVCGLDHEHLPEGSLQANHHRRHHQPPLDRQGAPRRCCSVRPSHSRRTD
jgi:hypothetical protein